MEQFWKAQDAILEETEAFSKAWFERRHEATRQAVEAVRKLNGEGGGGADPTAAMRAMAEWQQGSLRRMAQDMQEWVELCSRCAARVTDAEVEAGKKGAEKLATRARNRKQATPVVTMAIPRGKTVIATEKRQRRHPAMDEKSAYRQKLEARLDQWRAEIDKLQAKAAEASADAPYRVRQADR